MDASLERPVESRGRIVMLVDNRVRGDSRVQKQARSAAERGWDVILLGRSPDGKRHSWQLGEARVRLIPMPMPMARRRYEYRWAPLRSPLAIPEGLLSAYLKQKARARQADATTSRAMVHHEIASGERGAVAARTGQARSLAERVAAGVYSRWIDLRIRKTEQLKARRARMDAPVDKLSTAFWRRVLGDRSWRVLDPGLWDYELAYGPVIDRLQPDIIHANDFRMIGVGARAALRARMRGTPTKLVWDAHEYLPGVAAPKAHPRWHEGQMAYERGFVRYADAVTTVSPMMVDLLMETYALTTRPTIVLNTPTVGLQSGRDTTKTLREDCGLEPGQPLLVYSGAAAPQRGLTIMVDGLAELPTVHLALIVRRSAYVDELVARAVELGVDDRVHVVPYVPIDDICGYIASADVGVNPTLKYLNHEVDLPTKFYEYSQAHLPLVVSDVKTMAETTRANGQGEVFRAGDLDDYVRAVEKVLADPAAYRAAYDTPGFLDEWLWDRQADILDAVYESLLTEDV